MVRKCDICGSNGNSVMHRMDKFKSHRLICSTCHKYINKIAMVEGWQKAW